MKLLSYALIKIIDSIQGILPLLSGKTVAIQDIKNEAQRKTVSQFQNILLIALIFKLL
jgi:hypothetical protein